MVRADAYEFRIDGAWPESAMAVTERGRFGRVAPAAIGTHV
jgi:hypothetical protein